MALSKKPEAVDRFNIIFTKNYKKQTRNNFSFASVFLFLFQRDDVAAQFIMQITIKFGGYKTILKS